MNKQDLDDLHKATTLIFNVEQKWRKDNYNYAADTLYKARIEINNARSRGQKTKSAEELWKELGDIPINKNEGIDQDWHIFHKGTPRQDIWHWFESEYDISVAKDLMGL